MTVVLTHLFKLLSFSINICCLLLVYVYLITSRRNWDTARYCDRPIALFKVAAVNHLQYSFLKLLFWPSNRRPNQYAIFHPYTKFHKNRTIRCWVMAKTLFRKSQSWISKIWNLCEMTASFIGITFYAPNFIKIGRFLLRYGDLTIFKMAAVRHLGF